MGAKSRPWLRDVNAGVDKGRKGAASELGPQPLGQCHATMTQSTWHSDASCAVMTRIGQAIPHRL